MMIQLICLTGERYRHRICEGIPKTSLRFSFNEIRPDDITDSLKAAILEGG
jgi:hypothetical protein